MIHIVLGWTRPEHPWACSRNSCDTRTYQPMDQYGNASALAKRKANRPIVQRLLQRPANQEVSIQ